MNTDLENRMEDWYNDHLGCCCTCAYKQRGYCTNTDSQAYDERVVDKCGCNEWSARKGVRG